MTKTEAIAIFGTAANLARALECTRSAISQWPDELDQDKADRVVGAAVRLRKTLPNGVVAPLEAQGAGK